MYRLLKDKTSQYQKKISTKTTGNPFLNKSAKFVLIFFLQKFGKILTAWKMTRSKVTDAECQTPKENSTKVDWRKCMDENDITLDYVSWVYLPAGWQKSHERANGVRRKVNMLNFLNFFFSSIKYPLLFQNISSFFSNFRIKVQSRGRAFLEQFVLIFFMSCDCQFFPRLAVSPFWASTVIAAGHSSTTQNMWE